jgi:hypothetical protein
MSQGDGVTGYPSRQSHRDEFPWSLQSPRNQLFTNLITRPRRATKPGQTGCSTNPCYCTYPLLPFKTVQDPLKRVAQL